MTREELIKEQAKYYIENDDVTTMQQVAEHFGYKSKKTIQVNMKKLAEIDGELCKLVDDKKARNLAAGAIKGGQNGKPTIQKDGNHFIPTKPKSISDEEITAIAEQIIANRWTLREAEAQTGISKSTIHDNLTQERLGADLYNRYSSIAEFNKMNTNKDVPIIPDDGTKRKK